MNFGAHPPSKSGKGHAHAIALADVQPERLRWLSYGRLAVGKLTLLEGDPGLGKSTLLCEWSARISRGEALPEGEPGPPRGVVLLSAEDGLADTIRPRVEVAGGDLLRIIALNSVPNGEVHGRLPTIPGDLYYVEKLIERVDAALLIFDPLKSYLDPGINEFRDQDVRRALAPLAAMAERTGVAVLIIRHLNKNQGASAMYRGGGSIGIIGAARVGLVLAADPDDKEARVLAPVKGNLARPPAALTFRLESVPGTDVARLIWTGTSHHTADGLLAQADPTARTELDEAKTWLREFLRDGALPSRLVRAAASRDGISRGMVRRARQELGIRRQRIGFGPGANYVFALPGAAKPATTDTEALHVDHVDHVDHVGRDSTTWTAQTAPLPNLDPAPWEEDAEDDDLSFLDGTCLDCGAPLTNRRRYRCLDCQP